MLSKISLAVVLASVLTLVPVSRSDAASLAGLGTAVDAGSSVEAIRYRDRGFRGHGFRGHAFRSRGHFSRSFGGYGYSPSYRSFGYYRPYSSFGYGYGRGHRYGW